MSPHLDQCIRVAIITIQAQVNAAAADLFLRSTGFPITRAPSTAAPAAIYIHIRIIQMQQSCRCYYYYYHYCHRAHQSLFVFKRRIIIVIISFTICSRDRTIIRTYVYIIYIYRVYHDYKTRDRETLRNDKPIQYYSIDRYCTYICQRLVSPIRHRNSTQG